MQDLLTKQCNYKNNQKDPLTESSIRSFLEHYSSWSWDQEKGTIYKKFAFKDFYHTMSFVNAIAWIANKEAHHPDLQVSYGHCMVEFTTHDSGNQVTMNDLICAAKVDALLDLGQFGPKLTG